MKKLFTLFLISLMISYICIVPVAASSPTITIVGGEVAGGGVAGGTNAKGDMAAVIGCLALASQGIEVQAVNGSKIDFVRSLLEEYAEKIGSTFEQLCDLWLENVKVLANGLITLGAKNTKSISEWLESLIQEDKIAVPVQNSNFVVVNEVNCPVVAPGEYIALYDYYLGGNLITYGFINKSDTYLSVLFGYSNKWNSYGCFIFSKHQTWKTQACQNGNPAYPEQNFSGQPLNGLYYFYQTLGSRDYFVNLYIPYVVDFETGLSNLNGEFNIVLGMPDENTLSGDPSQVNPSDFISPSGNVTVLNPNIGLGTLGTAYGQNGISTVREYLETIIDLLNGDDASLNVNNSQTGLLDSIPISGYNPSESVTVGSENENVAENGTDLIDENQFPDAEKTQQYLRNMQFNLVNVFPFCLPFDIVNLLSKLDVTPITPNVTLSFPNPVLNEPIVFNLNFAQWDGVASVVRKMEVFAFVVGLAVITRNLIRG